MATAELAALICDCNPPICEATPKATLVSCWTLTASVGATPGAMLLNTRGLLGVPNDTEFGVVATEPWPMATELVAPACTVAPAPIAVPLTAATEALARRRPNLAL